MQTEDEVEKNLVNVATAIATSEPRGETRIATPTPINTPRVIVKQYVGATEAPPGGGKGGSEADDKVRGGMVSISWSSFSHRNGSEQS